MAPRSLAQGRCSEHTRPFPPILGAGFMTEEATEDLKTGQAGSRAGWTETATAESWCHARPSLTTHHVRADVAGRRDAGP